MTAPGGFNEKVIAEFRANDGRVGPPFEGASIVLLHTTGARSGAERVNPMVCRPLGDGSFAVFASAAGADSHPAWYHNLVAHPRLTAEVGTPSGIEVLEVDARTAEGDERERIWSAQKADAPGFAEYERTTTRTIPVVVLTPTGRSPDQG